MQEQIEINAGQVLKNSDVMSIYLIFFYNLWVFPSLSAIKQIVFLL